VSAQQILRYNRDVTPPSSSIPDLKSKSKPVLFIVLGLAVLLIIGGLVALLIAPKDKPNLGPEACKHVERQAEIEPEAWDAMIEELVKTVEERVVSKTENVPIQIQNTARRNQCTEVMRKLERSLEPERYDGLANCILSSGKASRALRCLEFVR
jgi:hypothetical protein